MKCFLLFTVAISIALAQKLNKYDKIASVEINSEEHGVTPGSSSTSCKCGWANKKGFSRIVNGKETEVNEYPFAAFIQIVIDILTVSSCGGTIISEYHVLTAAHCTKDHPSDKIFVAVGEHDRKSRTETNATQAFRVHSIINHPNYSKTNKINDIALITIQGKMAFSDQVGPACLPTRKYEFDLENKYVKVMGWGTTKTGGRSSNVLLQTNLRVISLDECIKFYKRIVKTNPTQLCTYSKGRDTCQGDSGGPVLYVDPATNRYTLVGVVSYGRECASKDPGINTDVSVYLDWIESSMKSSNPNGKICQKI